MGRTKNKGIGYTHDLHITRASEHEYKNSEAADVKDKNAKWTLQCVLALISVLKPHLSAAGDGHKFKSAVYKEAVAYLNTRIIAGGPKKEKGVKDKVKDLLDIYDAVIYLRAWAWRKLNNSSLVLGLFPLNKKLCNTR
ncbi:hypothetical protein BDP27DRAFT_1433679 [Rhodocollybia butyracea]|uniref:Uncharacterized protein n=1 Tax=Rhodocollybia butyracea TaxID=206335 RepID=A0A9P5TY41_9AGAR|nr:hypothetical protein BDP27DRAFT_1433679 [Rhodocollybia butyracea]